MASGWLAGCLQQGVVVITSNGMEALRLIDEELPPLLLEAGHKVTGYRDITFHPDRGEEQPQVEDRAVEQEERHGWPLVVLEWWTLHKILLLRYRLVHCAITDSTARGRQQQQQGRLSSGSGSACFVPHPATAAV